MKKIIISVLTALILLWGTFATVDFLKVSNLEKPIFCIPTETADDGGSGRYMGLGYYFDIKGSISAGYEKFTITCFDAYLFGIAVLHGIV